MGVSTVCVLLHRSRRSKRRALPLHIRARLCPAPGPPVPPACHRLCSVEGHECPVLSSQNGRGAPRGF